MASHAAAWTSNQAFLRNGWKAASGKTLLIDFPHQCCVRDVRRRQPRTRRRQGSGTDIHEVRDAVQLRIFGARWKLSAWRAALSPRAGCPRRPISCCTREPGCIISTRRMSMLFKWHHRACFHPRQDPGRVHPSLSAMPSRRRSRITKLLTASNAGRCLSLMMLKYGPFPASHLPVLAAHYAWLLAAIWYRMNEVFRCLVQLAVHRLGG